MIIVKLGGGLGNQMFQYAAAKALAVCSRTQLKLDISHFDRHISNETLRNYHLNVFPNIREKIAIREEVDNLLPQFKFDLFNKLYKNINKRIFNFNKSYKVERNLFYSPITLNTSKKVYLDGYWQSEKYFDGIQSVIKEDFSLDHLLHYEPLQHSIGLLQSEFSVSIHVRRGDYITNPSTNSYHGILGLDYYERAITKVISLAEGNPLFFIFSDDIDWCRKNLKIPYKHIYISTGIDHHDLYLMSICKHNIIANSSFSWWAAWLNKNSSKIIVAPKRWFAAAEPNNIVPDKWLTA